MSQQFREQVGQALDLLLRGAQPFVEESLRAAYEERWFDIAQGALNAHSHRGEGRTAVAEAVKWDAQAVLTLVQDQWFHVFRHKLDPMARSLAIELREFRNRWAHQDELTFEDAFRAVDGVRRLLEECESPLADDAARLLDSVLRVRMREISRSDSQNTARIINRGWWILVYAVCASAIVWQSWLAFGDDSLLLSGFVILTFIYFGWQRLRQKPKAVTGVQECPQCGRIIYRTPCPYCVNE